MYTHDDLTAYFEYLDDLRASGVTKMFGAPAYVQRDFALSTNEARHICSLWMQTFTHEHTAKARATYALSL
jgi:hypothetical protein